MTVDVTLFQALLKERTGLSFDITFKDKLQQAIQTRMAAYRYTQIDQYSQHLCLDHKEFQILVDSLTINETYFFREAEQLQLLVNHIIPRLLLETEPPLKIFSAGCSSGEEPYSLAMILWERYGEQTHRLFKIIGGDIDSTVINRARLGYYSAFSFRGVTPKIRDHYFQYQDRHYQLQEFIRSLVTFRLFNLSAPITTDLTSAFDIILYRNVSIYFDQATRQQIQKRLLQLLKSHGVLLVGISETLANDLGLFALQEEAGQFYFVKNDCQCHGQETPESTPKQINTGLSGSLLTQSIIHTAPYQSSDRITANNHHQSTIAAPASTVSLKQETSTTPSLSQLVIEHRFDEALTQIDSRLMMHAHDFEALLMKSAILLERQAFSDSQAVAYQAQKLDVWSLDVWLLLGLTTKWLGDTDLAVQHFRQAIYIQPDCWLAHYYLADLYREHQNWPLARRAWQRVVRILLVVPAKPTYVRIPLLELPRQKILFLCEHQLANLKIDDRHL
jgi:chemotaxis protein methyltransferase CheR